MNKDQYIKDIKNDCTCGEVCRHCCNAEEDSELSGADFPHVIKVAAKKQEELRGKMQLKGLDIR